MEQYFSLVNKEFDLRIKQIRQFIKHHNPSIGAFNEEILRKFLRDFLPKWVSVGQGFVLDRAGNISTQIDILIYNSTFYAPLYSVNDLVVLPPESVFIAIEVKTRVNKKIFQEIFPKNQTLKKINPSIDTQIFIYNPPSSKRIVNYLDSYDFSSYSAEDIPDRIYGLSKFYFQKENIELDNLNGVGYINEIYVSKGTDEKAIFEIFYYNIYRVIERKINQDLEKGIDNVFHLGGSNVDTKGRISYLQASFKDIGEAKIIIENKT